MSDDQQHSNNSTLKSANNTTTNNNNASSTTASGMPFRYDDSNGRSAVLNPTYKLLSNVKRTPNAVMLGKGHNFGGGSMSIDGALMSACPILPPPKSIEAEGRGDNDNDDHEEAAADGGGSKNATTHNNANKNSSSTMMMASSSARRVPPPPGPGAYISPTEWSPTKGPVRWQPALFPKISKEQLERREAQQQQQQQLNSSRSRSTSPRNEGGASSSSKNGGGGALSSSQHLPQEGDGGYYYSIAGKNGGAKVFSMSSKHDSGLTLSNKHRAALPGPGAYENSYVSQFSPRKTRGGPCLFGMRTKPLKSPREAFPGPGTYEVGTETPTDRLGMNGNSYRTTTLSGKWSDPTPPKSPNALTYRVPTGPFDFETPQLFSSGRKVLSMKGKLTHPMDSKDMAHEAAKTDHPHDPTKRMKIKPRA